MDFDRETVTETHLARKGNLSIICLEVIDISKPWENKSGCKDLTAYEAIKNVSEEEKRVTDFIKSVKTLASLCGLEIVSWIKVKVKKTGRTY